MASHVFSIEWSILKQLIYFINSVKNFIVVSDSKTPLVNIQAPNGEQPPLTKWFNIVSWHNRCDCSSCVTAVTLPQSSAAVANIDT